jgi:hypothetical protein
LANKISSEYAGTAFGPFLAELAREVAQDKETLEGLMRRLEIAQSPVKQTAGWVGEKLGRLKLSETMTGGQNLSMWRALIEISHSHTGLVTEELADLAQRAEKQRSGLEKYRLQLASQALTS